MYLSSYKYGDHLEALKKLAHDAKRVAIIMNAVDFGDSERVAKSVEKIKSKFFELGLAGEQLDLRDYFEKEDDLEEKLQKYDMVWVYGGNAFILRRAYEQSGFDKILKKRLNEDSLVYSGFSAAITVITPTLKGVEIVDDPSVTPEKYQEKTNLNGLGLLDYVVAAHYQSDHPESERIDKYISYCEENNIPYKTLRDGEVIVIDGEKEEILR